MEKTIKRMAGIADRFFLYAIILLSLILLTLIVAQNSSLLDIVSKKISSTLSQYSDEKNQPNSLPKIEELTQQEIEEILLPLPLGEKEAGDNLAFSAKTDDINHSESETISSPNSLAETIDAPVERYSALSDDAQEDRKSTLPTVNNQNIIESLQSLNSYRQLRRILITDSITQNTIKTIYGISKGQLIKNNRPLKLPANAFIATDAYNTQGSYIVSLKNYRRYDPYIRVLALTNTELVAGLYQRYEAHFEAEYEKMSTPTSSGTFYSVLIAAIDHLLAAPKANENARLYPTSDGYKFIDERLERMPATSKIMIRMGEENRRRLNVWLNSLKIELEKLQLKKL